MKKNVTKKIFYSAAATAVFAGSAVTGVNAIANADDDIKQFDKDSIVGGEYVEDAEASPYAYPFSSEPGESAKSMRSIEGTIVWDWNKSGEVDESDEGIPDWEVIIKSDDPVILEYVENNPNSLFTSPSEDHKYRDYYELPTDENPTLVGKVLTYDGVEDSYTHYFKDIDPVGFFSFNVPDVDAVYTIEVRNPENGELVFSDKVADFKEDPGIDKNNDWGFIKTGSLSGTIVWDNDKSKSVSDDDERIEGHLVELLKDGKVVETVKTDSDGFYKFDKLDAGDYEIRVKSPDGGELSFSDESATVKLGDEDKNNDWGFVTPDPAPEESPEPSPSDEPTPSEPSPSESPEPEPSTSEEPTPSDEPTPSEEPTPETTPRETPTIPEPEPRETPTSPEDTPSTTEPAARVIPSSPAPVVAPPAVNHTFPEKQPTPENPSRVNTPPFVPAQPPIAGPVAKQGPVVNTGGAVQESFWTKIVNLFR